MDKMVLNQTVKTFIKTVIDNKQEAKYIIADLKGSSRGGWDIKNLNDIVKYYSNTENQYCFAVYAYNKKLSVALLDKILYLLEIPKTYDKCNLFIETYPNSLK